MNRGGFVKSYLLVLSTLLLLACSQDLPAELLGSWHGETLRQDFSFSADGRVELVDHKHATYHGSYRLNGASLECRFDSFAYPVVREVKISGETLTLIDKTGRQEIYRR